MARVGHPALELAPKCLLLCQAYPLTIPTPPLARSLRGNKIGGQGASALVGLLRVLDLSSNTLGPEGGTALAARLKGNLTLQVLK
jgi:hypothetical protein